MSRASSNLRVFVHFKEETVFAGEDVEFTITFKNVATARKDTLRAANGTTQIPETQRGAAVFDQLKTARTAVRPGIGRSISVSTQGTARAGSVSENTPTTPAKATRNGSSHPSPAQGAKTPLSSPERKHKHGRSVSIISLGSAKDGAPPAMWPTKIESTSKRPSAHIKRFSSSSFQSIHDIDSINRPPGGRIPGQASPRTRSGASTPILADPPRQGSFAKTFPPPMSPRGSRHPSPVLEKSSRKHGGTIDMNDDQRPQLMESNSNGDSVPLQVQKVRGNKPSIDLRSPDAVDARLFSLRSIDETPRPSTDMYNMSNMSNETLVSEGPAQIDSNHARRNPVNRQSSFFTVNKPAAPPPTQRTEILMMGYVQVSGNFILDGSLVNRAPFEEVKRRAVVGGQAGGGVVGIVRSSAESGMFGALSWNNIGESLGGLLGSGQPSSMREMKDIAESESIPLLSTPKSILFVDLKLAPGQSKAYSYTFKMPRGLPPSHRGRAMKVSYEITIGTQRPGATRAQTQQQISQVSVPFRLFGGVNSDGESLGHDLMSPYIILKEKAIISSLEPGTPLPLKPRSPSSASSAHQAADFQDYVSHLLASSSNPDERLLSPSVELHPQTPRTPMTPRPLSRSASRSSSPPPSAPSTRTLIDHAIRWAGLRHSAIYSPTTFNIARASTPIAILKISRSALRLGDVLICVLDFEAAELPCYAVAATLESSERVDPTLAIRSTASVERVTRRVWARSTECTVGAKRSAWSMQVPVGGTPTFQTTGVGVEWCIRVEIVVGMQQTPPRQASNAGHSRADSVAGADGADEPLSSPTSDEAPAKLPATALPKVLDTLLEVVEADERGAMLAPKVRLQCESFEVVIPLRVFGAAVGAWGGESGGGAGGVAKEASDEGLAV